MNLKDKSPPLFERSGLVIRIQRNFLIILLLALIVRVGLLVIETTNPIFSTVDVAEYAPSFRATAIAIQENNLLSQIRPHLPFYSLLYPGWLYFLFGENGFLLVRLVNIVLSVLIIIPLNHIHKSLFDSSMTQWQVALVLFWPTYLRFSVSVDRTIISVLTVITAIAFVLSYLDDRSPPLPVVILVILIATLLRVHYLAYVSFFVLCIYLYKIKRSPTRMRILISLVVAIIGGISYALYEYIVPYGIDLPEDIIEIAKYHAQGDAAYLVNLYPEQWFDYVWYLPVHAFYFSFSPMPWDVLAINSTSAIVSTILAWSLLLSTAYILIRHRHRILHDWRIGSLLGALFLVATGFGAVVKNAGSAVRWRLPSTLLLLLVLTGFVYIAHRERRKKKYE